MSAKPLKQSKEVLSLRKMFGLDLEEAAESAVFCKTEMSGRKLELISLWFMVLRLPKLIELLNPPRLSKKPGPVPFFAAGISSVLHPKNPFAPTLHFNYPISRLMLQRMFLELRSNGGLVVGLILLLLTSLKRMSSTSIRFKSKPVINSIRHSTLGSRNGVMTTFTSRRGIFFDDLNDYDQEMLLSFATECASSVIPAYILIVEKRKDMPFNEQHKAWQHLRRGRYVEFNLVHDRRTTFGLETRRRQGGRIESILVSLPLSARWEYDQKPEEGTEEWKLLDACIGPKEWI